MIILPENSYFNKFYHNTEDEAFFGGDGGVTSAGKCGMKMPPEVAILSLRRSGTAGGKML